MPGFVFATRFNRFIIKPRTPVTSVMGGSSHFSDIIKVSIYVELKNPIESARGCTLKRVLIHV